MPSGGPADDPRDVPLSDMLGDVPLLREIQRVLLSSSGPINWELARQIGIAVASWGTDDPEPTEDERRAFADTARAAELAVADLTALPIPDVLDVQALRRAAWVELTVRDAADVLDLVGAKIATILGEQEASPFAQPGGQGQAELLAMVMQKMVPLMLGAQVGGAIGYLGQRAFGLFDLPFPRPKAALAFVAPNVARFEREWSVPAIEFRGWVALHEVTHRVTLAQPWVRAHFRGLVSDLVEHAEIDLVGLEQRLEGLDMSSPDALASAFDGVGNLFGQTTSTEQRLRVARVQAFVAAAEAYADHVVQAVARRMLPSYGQISEAVVRGREGGPSDRTLEQLLGVEMTPERSRTALAFCDRVVTLTSEATLSRMWGSPDSLPSMPELEEPSLWLARMA